ncbi:MAG: protease Lon-related BREX system protein BrxL [Acidimicrobiales bacterium]
MTEPRVFDELDRRGNEAFAGRVVRKDLVRQVKVGANVPVYVLEFLLGKYCASDDPVAVEAGLAAVDQILRENFIRPDESERAKAELKRRGTHRLIDKVDVRLVESEDKYWASLASFGSRFVHVPEELVYRYDRLLGGGVWCQVELVYSADEDETTKRPIYIRSLKPIQIAAFDLDEYATGRAEFTRDEWLDLVVRTIGIEPAGLDLRGKLLLVTRLVPMVERNFNLIELGPRGTGKSFVYRELSPNTILISGGKVTVPQLFVHLGTGRVGLLGHWDVVAFDEVAALELSDSTVVQMLKDYMESGSFARGREEIPAEASTVFVGNTSAATDELLRAGHLFADLPKAMIDTAFLDRLHFYLPGWEAPTLERRLFTDHYGFVSDYFSEALRQLRKRSYVTALDEEYALGSHLSARDEKAVRKAVSGYLKILHPHGHWTRAELRDYVELALEGRRRVKEQLRKLASYEFTKTDFSYIERDSGLEHVVGVPEALPSEPDDLFHHVSPPVDTPADEGVDAITATLDELLQRQESATLEFKATFRHNLHTDKRDEALELEVAKSVAGFMNGRRGGTLLIGVLDNGSLHGDERLRGLAEDIRLCGDRGIDGFENTLVTLLERTLGKVAASAVEVSFDARDGRDVCRVDAQAGAHPVYVEWKGNQLFFVRMGNSTRQFGIADAIDYIGRRFRS